MCSCALIIHSPSLVVPFWLGPGGQGGGIVLGRSAMRRTLSREGPCGHRTEEHPALRGRKARESTGHQAPLCSVPCMSVYLDAATAEWGVAVKAGDPGDEDAMCAPVVDADISWRGGKCYVKHKDTHRHVRNLRRPQRPQRRFNTKPFCLRFRDSNTSHPMPEGDRVSL